MLTPPPMASYDPESHVAPDFNCLDPRNAMVPLTMLLALCHTGASEVTLPKQTSYTSFQLSLPKEYSDSINDAVGIM